MLSRRQLRIKTLQSLYSYFQSGKSDPAIAERELFRSIEKAYELYIYLLLLFRELGEADRNDADELHKRFFPNQEELLAKRRLFELRFIVTLGKDAAFKNLCDRYRINWQNQQDLVRKIFLEIKKSQEYRAFLKDETAEEKDFLSGIFRKFIAQSDAIQHHIEEENIFWSDDFDFISQVILRMIRAYYDQGKLELLSLFRDEEDDRQFLTRLFAGTILHNKEFETAISEKTKNWDVDRIALMDILILKMALTELVTFPNIPVKVTINEYIDISKEFSTPKSKQFVNGVIDKLASDYLALGKIQKSGRGLIS